WTFGASIEAAGTHKRRRRPRWIGWDHQFESTGDPESKSPIDSRLGPPIGDPDPSTEGADVLYGCQRPRWRGQGRRLATPTPSPFDFSL
ncbi:hypothetical protein CRG98_012816, partial [Punica granatum]